MIGADRLRLALDLFEAAEALMRQNLRRASPHASEEEIEQKILEWLPDRPAVSVWGEPQLTRNVAVAVNSDRDADREEAGDGYRSRSRLSTECHNRSGAS